MPSRMHEGLVEMFRQRPELAAELLTHPLGVQVPAYRQVRLEPGELPELVPTEYRADAVVVFRCGVGRPVLVVGPDEVPVVDDADIAASAPELAVLSAVAHGGGPRRSAVLTALTSAFASLDDEHMVLYSDVVLAALPRAARSHLEALIGVRFRFEPQSEPIRRSWFPARAEGEAIAGARALLKVLDTRGVDVPADVRDRITACTDLTSSTPGSAVR